MANDRIKKLTEIRDKKVQIIKEKRELLAKLQKQAKEKKGNN